MSLLHAALEMETLQCRISGSITASLGAGNSEDRTTVTVCNSGLIAILAGRLVHDLLSAMPHINLWKATAINSRSKISLSEGGLAQAYADFLATGGRVAA